MSAALPSIPPYPGTIQPTAPPAAAAAPSVEMTPYPPHPPQPVMVTQVNPAEIAFDRERYRLAEFRRVVEKYRISPEFSARLRKLEDYEIILVADDSSSMATRVETPSAATGAHEAAFAPSRTRWMELKEFSAIVVDIASLMDSTGMDIYFLNRPPLRSVVSPNDPDLLRAFAAPPSGSTPLVATLNRIYNEQCARDLERKHIIIIATDGQPNEGIEKFKDVLAHRPKNTSVTILACTDDEAAVGYLNYIDRIIPGLDVVDDYYSECREILAVQGSSFAFTFGDYVVKVLLGSIDPDMDALDERKLTAREATRVRGERRDAVATASGALAASTASTDAASSGCCTCA